MWRLEAEMAQAEELPGAAGMADGDGIDRGDRGGAGPVRAVRGGAVDGRIRPATAAVERGSAGPRLSCCVYICSCQVMYICITWFCILHPI